MQSDCLTKIEAIVNYAHMFFAFCYHSAETIFSGLYCHETGNGLCLCKPFIASCFFLQVSSTSKSKVVDKCLEKTLDIKPAFLCKYAFIYLKSATTFEVLQNRFRIFFASSVYTCKRRLAWCWPANQKETPPTWTIFSNRSNVDEVVCFSEYLGSCCLLSNRSIFDQVFVSFDGKRSCSERSIYHDRETVREVCLRLAFDICNTSK